MNTLSTESPPAVGIDWPPDANLADFLVYRHLREGTGEAAALRYRAATLSYRDVACLCAGAAEVLRSRNVAPGDRVLMLLPDSPAFVAAFLGSVAIGAIAVPVNPALREDEVIFIAAHVGAKLVVVHESFAEKFGALAHVPGLETVLRAGDCQGERSEFDLAVAASRARPERARAETGTLAYCLFSSGTTGPPKGIVHRHTDILHCADAYAERVLGMNAGDTVLAVPKLTFGYGLGGNLLFSLRYGGTAILVPEPSTAEGLAATARRERPTVLLAQPRMLAALLREPAAEDSFSSVRVAASAGEVLSPALFERWQAVHGTELLDGFGSTEMGHVFISNRPGDVRPGCAGRVLPGYEVAIVDGDGRNPGSGAIGELLARGASAAPYYWNDPERTATAFRGGWVASGDLFRQDAQGYLYFCGRADEMIKAGCGEWVSPAALETVLSRHDAVLESAVVGASDGDGVVKPRAWVVLHADETRGSQLADELMRLVADEWPDLPYMHLDSVSFTPALPRTLTGKVQRFRLDSKTLTEFSYDC